MRNSLGVGTDNSDWEVSAISFNAGFEDSNEAPPLTDPSLVGPHSVGPPPVPPPLEDPPPVDPLSTDPPLVAYLAVSLYQLVALVF